jgi:hypothetical protein
MYICAMKKLILILIGITLLTLGVLFIRKAATVPAKSVTQTQIQIFNDTKDTVLTYVTLGATPGCLQQASLIPFITDTVPGQRNLQGCFFLPPGDSTIAYAPDSLGYNGVISFLFPPDNCPAPSYTNGINQFEFMINNQYQGANAQESINISAVHGVNCVIRVNALTTNFFNAGPTIPKIQSFANTMNRSDLTAGVYPYGCDTCTGSKSPPVCILLPQPKQTASICQVQRNASTPGGIIQVRYLGQVNILK